jgi:hypothetical protein
MAEPALSPADLRALKLIDEVWVCASYWEDEIIKRYRALGLVASDGECIRLTDAGRQACASEPWRSG